MTVVVWRDGVLAADSASWCGPLMVRDDTEKVVRVNGDLIGCAGEETDIEAFVEWYRNGGVPDQWPKFFERKHFVAIVAGPAKVVQMTDKRGEPNVQDLTDMPEGWAIGYETGFIRGLLAAGKSAVECVEIAIERCAYVGGKVMSMKMEPAQDGLLVDIAGPPRVETWRDSYGLGDAAS